MAPALSFLFGIGKVIGILVFALALFVAGNLGWAWFRPDHYFNDINRFNHERFIEACRAKRCPILGAWSASMIPEVFTGGESREEVVRRLDQAGYHENGDDHYVRRGVEMPVWYCGMDFYVSVAFDEMGGLTEATSRGSGVCL